MNHSSNDKAHITVTSGAVVVGLEGLCPYFTTELNYYLLNCLFHQLKSFNHDFHIELPGFDAQVNFEKPDFRRV